MSTSESDKNAEREIDAMTDGQVAPTPTGTSNTAAAARAKEFNLAAKKSPPAAQKPLMHPPSVAPQQSESGLTDHMGSLGKSTTPPARAAPTDAASAARGPAGAAKGDESSEDEDNEFMPPKKPVPAGDPHAIKVAALNMEAAKLGIKVSNVQACHHFIEYEEDFKTANVTFTDCATLPDNKYNVGEAHRKSSISLSSVKSKHKEITDALLNYNDSQELSLSTQDVDAEDFMPPDEKKKEDEDLDPEDEETYDS